MHNLNVFCNDLQDDTLRQMLDCMEPDWVVRGALMPDAHLGYSMPIGGVVMTDSIVVPAWVGYDIGCGVCAVKTNLSKDQAYNYNNGIYTSVKRAIPMGFNRHKEPMTYYSPSPMTYIGQRQWEQREGALQLGTLGGGNHFIEMCIDNMENVYIVIHSGSRGTGHGTCREYLNFGKDRELKCVEFGGFRKDTLLYDMYMADMKFLLNYALENRMVMLKLIEDEVRKLIPLFKIDWSTLINKNHNHAEVQGEYIIHRKGATSAKEGEYGVIPGNMRDGSYIVRGLGLFEALQSCSHGAGRKYSRAEAKKKLSMEEFKTQMMHIRSEVSEKLLDEAPGAYKNFNSVMDQQKNMCVVITKLRPIINWKA